MKSDERPQKIRKLSHSPEANDQNVHAIEENPAYDNEYDQAQQHQHDAQVNTEAVPTTTTNPSAEHDGPESSKRSVSTLDAPSATPKPTTTLSKNQLKKLRKQQEWDAGRDARRVKRKEKTKERRQRKREQRDQEAEDLKASGANPIPQSKPQRTRHVRLPVTFLIDCGFDDKMAEKERISLASQLTRSYSDNHKAPYQAHLVVSSWGGELKNRFDTVLNAQHVNWKGIRFTEEDFVDAAAAAEKDMSGSKGGKLAGVFERYSDLTATKTRQLRSKDDDNDKKDVPISMSTSADGTEGAEPQTQNAAIQHLDPSSTTSTSTSTSTSPLPPRETIYLTSDSPHTLTSLSPYSTYIIGGLVDKNRHKGICYRTATERNVKTAKLPIGELMEMQSRFVLATNHVVEIMVRWLECGDWGEAFMRVIPKRKGGRLRTSGGGDGNGNENENGGDEEDDDVVVDVVVDDDDDNEQERDNGSEEQNEDGDKDIKLDDVLSESGQEAGTEHSSTLDATNGTVTDMS